MFTNNSTHSFTAEAVIKICIAINDVVIVIVVVGQVLDVLVLDLHPIVAGLVRELQRRNNFLKVEVCHKNILSRIYDMNYQPTGIAECESQEKLVHVNLEQFEMHFLKHPKQAYHIVSNLVREIYDRASRIADCEKSSPLNSSIQILKVK